jgi:hypothetical protein
MERNADIKKTKKQRKYEKTLRYFEQVDTSSTALVFGYSTRKKRRFRLWFW